VRVPFFYGWVVVAVTFVTMAVGVNARTAFSLFFPPILQEFGWERGLTAGAFAFGFLISNLFIPFLGRAMDRWGPRVILPAGVLTVCAGLGLATFVQRPWQLYVTLGVLVATGTTVVGYTGQAFFLPNWFVRRRGLAMGLAFSGVGIGSMVLFPSLQRMIDAFGWRAACWTLAAILAAVVVPLNAILARQRPEDLGLAPDGDPAPRGGERRVDNVADPAWAAVDWTVRRALRTPRFWWVFVGFVTGLTAWYAVQVHQTKYLIEIGFTPAVAATALGLVSFTGIGGQIGLGHLSDRIGREWAWTLACLGFAICYAALLVLRRHPDPAWLWVMVGAQGLLGYGISSVFGSIVAELFQGRHYGSIFGLLGAAAGAGAGLGPFMAGVLYDRTGRYTEAFLVAIACCAISAVAIWRAAPRKVRVVAGRLARMRAAAR
jgi:MFS family permease